MSRRAFSRATTRIHVDTPSPAACAARSSSARSDSVASTLMWVVLRDSSAIGGRPIRGCSLDLVTRLICQ